MRGWHSSLVCGTSLMPQRFPQFSEALQRALMPAAADRHSGVIRDGCVRVASPEFQIQAVTDVDFLKRLSARQELDIRRLQSRIGADERAGYIARLQVVPL